MSNGFNHIPEFRDRLEEKKYRAAVQVGEFCVRMMHRYVPVRTGHLKSRCAYEIIETMDNVKVRLINNAEYAGYVEFGTRKMMPNPFMKDSVQYHISDIQRIIRRNLRF